MYTDQLGQSLDSVTVWSCTTDSLVTAAGKIIVIRVCGEVDLATLPALEAALDASLDQQPNQLVVDLARLTFCSARGMTLFAITAGYAAGQGVGYAVSGVPAWLDRIWQIIFNDELPVRCSQVTIPIAGRAADSLVER